MMFLVFRYFGDPVYKADGLGEVIELERALDVLLLEFPFRHLLQSRFCLFGLQQVSHKGERVTPSNLFAMENRRSFFRDAARSETEDFSYEFGGIEHFESGFSRYSRKPGPVRDHLFSRRCRTFEVAHEVKPAFPRKV